MLISPPYPSRHAWTFPTRRIRLHRRPDRWAGAGASHSAGQSGLRRQGHVGGLRSVRRFAVGRHRTDRGSLLPAVRQGKGGTGKPETPRPAQCCRPDPGLGDLSEAALWMRHRPRIAAAPSGIPASTGLPHDGMAPAKSRITAAVVSRTADNAWDGRECGDRLKKVFIAVALCLPARQPSPEKHLDPGYNHA